MEELKQPKIKEVEVAPRSIKRGRPVSLVLLTIVLILAGAGAYYWRDAAAKQQQKQQQTEISQLNEQLSKTKQDLATEKAKTAPAANEEPTAAVSSLVVQENIEAAIQTGNTAALEGYMASSVKVIIAASEGLGDRTPTQAIQDLGYLTSAMGPWNFLLPATTLAGYSTGDYGVYFPAGALVGKSADNYVIAFSFNTAGKISGIFMAVNADLLM